MMRTLALVILTLTLTGCAAARIGTGSDAVMDRLARPMTDLARALAGDDVAQMRAAGRSVIATYDAGVKE